MFEQTILKYFCFVSLNFTVFLRCFFKAINKSKIKNQNIGCKHKFGIKGYQKPVKLANFLEITTNFNTFAHWTISTAKRNKTSKLHQWRNSI